MEAMRALDELWWLDGDDYMLEAPPLVCTDERRLQVRAYNRWSSLLAGRAYPTIEDLRTAEGGFGDNAVVLDFSAGPANPAIVHLGATLKAECGLADRPRTVADVPARSLLSRLTDHYLRIITNRAPIGFEAEFTSQRGLNTLYRGILMPCSSDDVTIDYIYGVINWKELADTDVTAELEIEIDRALRDGGLPLPAQAATQARPDALSAARAAPALARLDLDVAEEFVVLLVRRSADGGAEVLAALPAETRLVESVALTL